MHARNQRTLKNSIRCVGIGRYNGERVELTLKPAGPNHGIVFHRTGTPDKQALPALWNHIEASSDSAVLGGNGSVEIRGIEQLLSAAAGAGLDNLEIEIDGMEVPILDGSAEPFVFLLSCAGSVEQDAPCKTLKILRRVEVGVAERFASLEPYEGFALDVEINEEHPLIGRQRWIGDVTIARYQTEIARARSYACGEKSKLQMPQGTQLGEAAENPLILGPEMVFNSDGLRYPDEPVRHKVLEVIGDLRMVGGPIIGKFKGKSVDHGLVLSLLHKLFEAPDSWQWLRPGTIDDFDETHSL